VTALKSVLAVALAAVILYAMQRTTPGYGDITAPIAVSGKIGERIDARAYAIGLQNIRLARELRIDSYGKLRAYTTSGVWVIVEGAGESKYESLALTSASWRGPSGIRYWQSQRLPPLPGLLGGETFEPGLPRPFLIVFEVPESELAGGAVLLARSALTPLDEEVRVAVGEVKTTDIRPAALIKRNDSGLPWSLEMQ
jgi:hypothetical protein